MGKGRVFGIEVVCVLWMERGTGGVGLGERGVVWKWVAISRREILPSSAA